MTERYLRGLIRRLLKEAGARIDENCAFCDGIDGDGFVNCGRHHPDCPGNEARKYLAKKREANCHDDLVKALEKARSDLMSLLINKVRLCYPEDDPTIQLINKALAKVESQEAKP